MICRPSSPPCARRNFPWPCSLRLSGISLNLHTLLVFRHALNFFVAGSFVPTGQLENSPAFQRREKRRATSVPQGRLNGRRIVFAIANDFVLQTSTVPSGLAVISRSTRR